MAELVNDLGGERGFGEQILARNDDGSTNFIDLTSVFGSGINFFGQVFTGLFVNNNGNVTFTNPLGQFTPTAITGASSFGPIIAPFFADVDTRGGAVSPTPGGTSTGSNLLYYDLDVDRGVFTVTWDDVGYFSNATNRLNAFQLQLIRVGESDFDIVFRYEEINFTTGSASGGDNGLGGTVARAGYTSGDGQNFFELPQSGNQSQILDLENSSNINEAGVHRFQVRNGAPTVNISVSDARIAEGNVGNGGLMTFDVILSAPSDMPVSVDYFTSFGTADSTDFASQAGTLTFAAGQIRQTVSVRVTGDVAVEADETLILNLTNAQGATLVDSTATGVIVNDDGLSVDDVRFVEGSGDTPTQARFVVRLLSASTEAVTVDFATQDGTATVAGSDYVPTSGTLTFAAGEVEKVVLVDVVADRIGETDETFRLVLSNPVGSQIADGSGTATIVNDDGFVINDVSRVEGTGAANTQFVFNVDLLSAMPTQSQVSYRILSGTAVVGEDVVAGSGTLTFNAGATRQSVIVNVVADSLVETNETFQVELINAVGTSIVDSIGEGRIVDDDGFRVSDARVTEGAQSVTTSAVFTVTLGSSANTMVSVDYAVTAGTATSGSDFTPVSGTLVFQPGVISQTISVPVIGDSIGEANETFFLNLANPVGTGIVRGQGTGTIVNDDGVSVANAVSVQEGNGVGAPNIARFTISLSSPLSQDVTVGYSTADGTASAGEDYTAVSGSVVIRAGSTTATVDVEIVGDQIFESNETFLLQLTSADGVEIIDGNATGFIQNDDVAPPPSISVFDVRQTEGDSGTQFRFLVGLDRVSDSSFSVQYNTSDGTALAGQDYVATSGTLQFAAGERFKEVVIDILADTVLENDETFFLNLLNASNSVQIADNQAQGLIVNDDLELRVNDVTLREGNTGQTFAVFTVRLNGNFSAGLPVSVQYSTVAGTANAGDFTEATGTVTFEPGQTSQTISIALTPDRVYERDEQFSILLNNASNARIIDGTGVATLQNDDAPLRPIIRSSSVDTGVSNSDRITNDNTQTLLITGSQGSIIQVFDGATLLGNAVETGAGNFSFTTALLSDGIHGFTAVALPVDSGPSSAASTVFNVQIDTQAPSRAVINSIAQDTGASNSDGITADKTVTLNITAEAGSTVVVRNGATILGNAVEVSAGRFEFTSQPLPDGTHALTAQATDVAGNQGQRSLARNVVVDTQAPVAPTIDSIENDTGSVGDLVTSDNTLTLSLGAMERGIVQVFDGAQLAGEATYLGLVEGIHKYAFTTQTLSDGAHAFSAQLVDTAGNTSVASATQNVLIDTQAPVLLTAVLQSDGVNLKLTFNSTLHGNLPATSQFEVRAGGNVVGVSSVTVQGQEAVLLLATAVSAGQSVLVTYRDGSAEDDSSALQDLAGNDVSTFSDVSVVNNVPQQNTLITGTPNPDLLTGTNQDDTIRGLAGEDTLIGLDGNDSLDGGSGADLMEGGLGNDTYVVDSDLDVVVEARDAGIDTVRSAITFTLGANLENLVLTGALDLQGNGNASSNIINGNGGNNVLNGAGGNDTLTGGNGNDTLGGGAGNDSLNGGAGNDMLNGGTGADTMVGGAGNDTYFVDVPEDVIIESPTGGIDTVRSSITFRLNAVLENLSLTGGANVDGFGNDQTNVLIGNSGGNRLSGGNGDDVLDGRAGADTLEGGSGNDVYFVDNSGDVVLELQSQGTDHVNTTVTYQLGEHLENLTTSSAANISLSGNSADNRIVGGAGNNRIEGGDGNDVLFGRSGADVIVGGNGSDLMIGGSESDIFVFASAADSNGLTSQDVILDFISGEDKIDLSSFSNGAGPLRFVGSEPFDSVNSTGEVRFEAGYLFLSTNSTPDAELVVEVTGIAELNNSDFLF